LRWHAPDAVADPLVLLEIARLSNTREIREFLFLNLILCNIVVIFDVVLSYGFSVLFSLPALIIPSVIDLIDLANKMN